MRNSQTYHICKNIISSYENALPSDVVETTRLHMADYFAACIAGKNVNNEFNHINKEIMLEMAGVPESQILFSSVKVPAPNAAFMNAIYAHGADMDDGNSASAGHIATHVFPAVFSLADCNVYSWEHVFKAINVGYDVFNITGASAQPYLYSKGFHSTGIAGGVACAAACCYMLMLSAGRVEIELLYNAISLAAIQSSGLILIDESGQACKPINPANAARTGVLCARMAIKGVKGPLKPFESNKGWLNAYGGDSSLERFDKLLGKTYTILDSYIKKYPSCRHTHSCIEAASRIHDKFQLKVGDIGRIKAIEVYIYANAIRSAGTIRIPNNSEEAKFSISYAAAVSLLYGEFKLSDVVNVRISDEIYRLINLIVIVEDQSTYDSRYNYRGCRMRVELDKGEEHVELVRYPSGEFDRPLTWQCMREKMYQCSLGCVDSEVLESILDSCSSIDLKDQFNLGVCSLLEE